MKTWSIRLLRAGPIILGCLVFSWGGSSSSAYQVARSSLNQGGSVWLSQSSFQLCSSLGQNPAGKHFGDTTVVNVGFWNPWVTWVVPVEEDEESAWFPANFELEQNYPNPFNPTTLIRYALPRASQVRIEIFNLLGQRVRILLDGRQSPGNWEIQWDGTDGQGMKVSSGIYFCRIAAADFVACRKMTLVK
jgi:hypothetical protein